MNLVNKIINIFYQILAGAFYTLVIYYIGTFNPNHYVLRDFQTLVFNIQIKNNM